MDVDDPGLAAAWRDLGGRDPTEHDFKVETHPRAEKRAKYFPYDSYTPSPPPIDPAILKAHSFNKPKHWAPFVKRLDFEVVEFMRNVGLNRKQMNTLITLVNQIKAKPRDFTLVDAKNVREMWKISAEHCNVGVRIPVTIPDVISL
jgi:hypothetical protein